MCSTDSVCDVHGRYLIGLRQVRITRHVLGSKRSVLGSWELELELGPKYEVSRLPDSPSEQTLGRHSQRQDFSRSFNRFYLIEA